MSRRPLPSPWCAVFENSFNPALQIEDCRCSFLAGFHARLVVGVDVDQIAVEANSPFEQSYQRTKATRIKATHADAEALAPSFRQR